MSIQHSGSVKTVSILFVCEWSMAFAYASLDGWTACGSTGKFKYVFHDRKIRVLIRVT